MLAYILHKKDHTEKISMVLSFQIKPRQKTRVSDLIAIFADYSPNTYFIIRLYPFVVKHFDAGRYENRKLFTAPMKTCHFPIFKASTELLKKLLLFNACLLDNFFDSDILTI